MSSGKTRSNSRWKNGFSTARALSTDCAMNSASSAAARRRSFKAGVVLWSIAFTLLAAICGNSGLECKTAMRDELTRRLQHRTAGIFGLRAELFLNAQQLIVFRRAV